MSGASVEGGANIAIFSKKGWENAKKEKRTVNSARVKGKVGGKAAVFGGIAGVI